MAGQGKSRKRLLLEIRYLQEETAPDTPIDIEGLRSYLGELTAIRSIIYQDLHEMEEMGFGIRHTKNGHYYYDRQSFTQGELSLMIDLICCAGYPDAESARNLILHIKQMGNNEQFDKLTEQTWLFLRNKADNPECIPSTDLIHEAIRKGKRIRFQYAHTDRFGNSVPDSTYTLSPYQLIWNNSRLYVIGGYESKTGFQLRSFRVDKIYSPEMLTEKLLRLPREHAFYSTRQRGFDAERYLQSTFDMFNAKDEQLTSVTLCAANYLIGAMTDTFGQELQLQEYDAAHMQFTADIQVSNMFFGWLARFTADQVRILAPAGLAADYRAHLQSIIDGIGT